MLCEFSTNCVEHACYALVGADTGTLLVRNTRWVRNFFGTVKQLLASDQSLAKVCSVLPRLLLCRHRWT